MAMGAMGLGRDKLNHLKSLQAGPKPGAYAGFSTGRGQKIDYLYYCHHIHIYGTVAVAIL